VVVDRAGRAKRRARAAEIAVEVSDRDEPLRRRHAQCDRLKRAASFCRLLA
jgi:hypothetical protein